MSYKDRQVESFVYQLAKNIPGLMAVPLSELSYEDALKLYSMDELRSAAAINAFVDMWKYCLIQNEIARQEKEEERCQQERAVATDWQEALTERSL